MSEFSNDSRFTHIAKDPRFRHMKKKDRKVKIDNRFHGMFKDDRFKVKYTVDKRGRPVRTTSNDHLRRFYELSSSEDDSDDDSADDKVKKKSKKKESPSELPSTKLKKKESKKESMKKKKGEKKNATLSTENVGKKAVVVSATGKCEELEEHSGSDDQESEEENGSHGEDEDHPGTSDSEEGTAEVTGKPDDDDEEEDEDSDGSSSGDEEEDGDKVDLARGQGNIESSSSDEDEDEEEEEEEEEDVEHEWGELDKSAPVVEDATRRLAVCNMDWDRIKAADLMVLLNSFKPAGGVIRSVSIYPSDFGLKRMAEEDVMGPIELVESARELQRKNKTETEEGDAYHRERLRQYQLNRLKYYYAIVECDSARTGNAIYEGADGIEYESSATKIDLRFVPEDMVFDQSPKSVCSAMPDASTYKPTLFTNTALNQSKVDLTWDETDKDRITMTMRKFTKDDLEKMDFQDYLAGSSDEGEEGYDPYGGFEEPDFGTPADQQNEEDDEEKIEKYNEMIKSIKMNEENKSKKDTELEISWEPGLKETTSEIVKKKTKHKDGLTPWEEYLEKKKEKKKQKREQKQAPTADRDDDADSEDADEVLSDDELPADVDLNDPYFKEELERTGDATSTKNEKKKKRLSKEEKEALERKEAELALLMMDEDDGKAHFSLKGIQEQEKAKKKKRKFRKKNKEAAEPVQDGFELNVEDPRFKDIYQNPLFNIDPSAPEFKKTKATDKLIEEKQKRRSEDKKADKRKFMDQDNSPSVKKKKQSPATESIQTDTSLSSLVKSVKAKTRTLQEKKKKKLK